MSPGLQAQHQGFYVSYPSNPMGQGLSPFTLDVKSPGKSQLASAKAGQAEECRDLSKNGLRLRMVA